MIDVCEESKFKRTIYEQIDYEDENGFIIGTVLLYKGKVCNISVGDKEIGNKEDLKKLQEFLKEIEQLNWLRTKWEA